MRAFEYRHVVSFEETNVVGNVYYVNHLRWQGRCRELFLRQFCPDVVKGFAQGLALATVSVNCEYFAELEAFDVVILRMRLGELVQNRLRLDFEYYRQNGEAEQLVARGEQVVACMQREGDHVRPAPIPQSMLTALQPYM